MGVTSSNKTVDVTEINCGGSVKITLALSASPDIVENPTDIVLVLDRSGSMTGAPRKLKAAAFAHYIDTDFRCC